MGKENKQEVNIQHGNTKLMLGEENIRVYELDFGDTNFVCENKKDILKWISADIDNINEDGLEYKITTKFMTRKELDELPEWS